MQTNLGNESRSAETNGQIDGQQSDARTFRRRPILKALGTAGAIGVFSGFASAADEGNAQTDESFDVAEATIAEIRTAITTETTTARAVTKQYLDRIEKYDDELNSIITVNPNALERAKELDSTFADSGPVGPLHGIPTILKDNYDTGDLPTTAASVALEDSIPPDDAFVVARLREAGAIILAKGNMHEYAYGGETVSSLGGQTRNAYALDRLPEGSSGGSAAAIAANLGAISTGSDTCSSVRGPPAVNNLVGIRPTMGLVSRDGIIPLSETQDTGGPMTRTVTDAAAMLDTMAGYDPSDSITARSIGQIPDDGYVSYLNSDGLDGAQIGVSREFFGIQGDPDDIPVGEESAAEVTAVVDTAIEDMKSEGATIIDPVTYVTESTNPGTESLDADSITELLDGTSVTNLEFKRDINNYLDSLDDPPVDNLAEIIETGQYFPETFRSDEYDAEELAGGIGDALRAAEDVDVDALNENTEYLRRLANREAVKTTILATMAESDVDALLYPTTTVPPQEIGQDQPFSQANCEQAAFSGLPAVTVPAGFTASDELPVGVELLGHEFAEPRLIELVYSYEQATMHRRPPDEFGH